MSEELKDHKKLISTFNNDDLITKTILITYIEDELIKVFEDHKTSRNVFEVVSLKYATMIATHI